MRVDLPDDWLAKVGAELKKPYFEELAKYVDEERRRHTIFPPEEDVFNAMKAAPFDRVSVLILGQDPYHGDNQAHGYCFSVRPGVAPPPSLVNIFRELCDDTGCCLPGSGCLLPWAEKGVLLLNAVLTVRAGEPNSHRGKGWETFTDAVIRALNDRVEPVVFVLWGAYARKKVDLIDAGRHRIIQSAHPSPLSARNGFFGSRPFSQINAALRESCRPEIDWQIPD